MSRHGSGDEPPESGTDDPWTSVPAKRPRRKRVVLAEGKGARRVLRTIVELEEQTAVGEQLIRSLVRAQLRAAVQLAALTVVLLGGLPLAFYFWPSFADLTVFGVRLSWMLLGTVPFPLIYGVGYWYVRIAERHERDFVNMVES